MVANAPPIVKWLLVLLSFMVEAPPEEETDAPAVDLAVVAPLETWAAASVNVAWLRENVANDETEFPAAPFGGEEGETIALPALAEWVRDECADELEAFFGTDMDAMEAWAGKVRRVHAVLHGLSATGPAVALVVEGPTPDDTGTLLADLRKKADTLFEEAAAEDGAPPYAAQVVTVDGRELTLVSFAAGHIVVGCEAGATVVANSVRLAKTLLRRLGDPAADDVEDTSLEVRLDAHDLDGPDMMDDESYAWVYVNPAFAMPYLGGLDFAQLHHSSDRWAVGAYSLLELAFDLSSAGPVVAEIAAEGSGSVTALSSASEWRRWLGGAGEARHAPFAVDADKTLWRANFALGDAPGLFKAVQDRLDAVAALNAVNPYARAPWRDVMDAMQAGLMEEPAEFLGRFRELGFVVYTPPADAPLADALMASAVVTARFQDKGAAKAFWENLVRIVARGGEPLTGWGRADGDGVRMRSVPIRHGITLTAHFGDDLATFSLNAERGRETLAAALAAEELPEEVDGAYAASFLDLKGALAYLRTALPDLAGNMPGNIDEMEFPWLVYRAELDDAGIVEIANSPLSVVAGAGVGAGLLLPALSRARERARETSSLSNVKQLMLGTIIFADDNDGRLPATLRGLDEYLGHDDAVFLCPRTGLPYRFIMEDVAEGVRERINYDEMKMPSQMVVVYSEPMPDGRRAVGYWDGHAEIRDEDDFQRQWEATKEALNALPEKKADGKALEAEAF